MQRDGINSKISEARIRITLNEEEKSDNKKQITRNTNPHFSLSEQENDYQQRC